MVLSFRYPCELYLTLLKQKSVWIIDQNTIGKCYYLDILKHLSLVKMASMMDKIKALQQQTSSFQATGICHPTLAARTHLGFAQLLLEQPWIPSIMTC